jgi:hypothetical protein
MGGADRGFRIVLGLALLIFAATGVPATGWNVLGWIGIVPLVTALVGWCPLYTVLGLRTGGAA